METKRPVLGQVLICSGCCCGRTDTGKPPVPVDWLKAEWKGRKLHKSVHLSISGCLGPCDLVNVVCIVTPAGMIWLGGLTEQCQYAALLEWAAVSAATGALLPLPAQFDRHRFERFRPEAEACECPSCASGKAVS